MTDRGATSTTQHDPAQMRQMIDLLITLSDCNPQILRNVSENNMKPPNKNKKQPNKKLEALKKKAADEKAKHLKTLEELRLLKIQAQIENKKRLVEKRKSLLQKEEERLQSLMKKSK